MNLPEFTAWIKDVNAAVEEEEKQRKRG